MLLSLLLFGFKNQRKRQSNKDYDCVFLEIDLKKSH